MWINPKQRCNVHKITIFVVNIPQNMFHNFFNKYKKIHQSYNHDYVRVIHINFFYIGRSGSKT